MAYRRLFFSSAIAVTLLFGGPAAAQGDSEKKPETEESEETAPPGLSETLTGMAKAEYESGKILYMDGDYTSALVKFRRAYEESKDARLLWNMAAAEKNLRRYANVKRHVEQYLAEGGDKLTEQDRADAKALLDAIAAFITTVTFDVKPEGADIFVDDELAGKSPLAEKKLYDMGSRKIRVTKQGYVEHSELRELPGGGQVTIALTLQEVVHEGRLRVIAGPNQTIRVDGKVVGVGQYEGTLPSGTHQLRVTAPDHQPYESDVVVRDDQLSTMTVSLTPIQKPIVADEPGGFPWGWVLGGVAVAAGAGVGGYFLFRGDDRQTDPIPGTIGTGVVQLPLWGR